jgi:hypothetical protein
MREGWREFLNESGNVKRHPASALKSGLRPNRGPAAMQILLFLFDLTFLRGMSGAKVSSLAIAL